MLTCVICGRRLTKPAATITTADGTGHAGPTCARKAGWLPARAPRLFTVRRRKTDNRQLEITC